VGEGDRSGQAAARRIRCSGDDRSTSYASTASLKGRILRLFQEVSRPGNERTEDLVPTLAKVAPDRSRTPRRGAQGRPQIQPQPCPR
jgi:hypothetical protein